MKYSSCCFTGHRELDGSLDEDLLKRVIVDLIKQGTQDFYFGMARGFDLIALQIAVQLKNIYPNIRLHACMGYEDQLDHFNAHTRQEYLALLPYCEDTTSITTYYDKTCMLRRDRYMVDRSQVVICYLRKKSGGTYYTVQYAKSKSIPVIEL